MWTYKDNLSKIKLHGADDKKQKISVGQINARSVKNKTFEITKLLLDNDNQREIKTIHGIFDNHSLVDNGVNSNNLIAIEKESLNLKHKLKVSYMNARSICNKSDEIVDFILDSKSDVTAITETWLSGDAERDKVVCGNVTPKGYKLETASRKTW